MVRSVSHVILVCLITATTISAFVPLLDGGTDIPQLYQSWFDDRISKQASTAVQKAIRAGYSKIEVNFPTVPNVDEVRFGTPLNQKFGTNIVAKGLNVKGGYKPGSDLSRQLIAFSNLYWAKQIAPSMKQSSQRPLCVITSEPVTVSQIQDRGSITEILPLTLSRAASAPRGSAIIAINPGGEEAWDRIRTAFGSDPAAPFVVLNNAYSTTYGLGNQRGYEEVYFVKRISKGWIFRTFPGPWKAYLERPDGTCELLTTFTSKPALNQVAAMVRDESFKRYAINNDRWLKGFGGRL